MRILFYDTETNGLPKNRWIPYTQSANWPSIVQLAWEVWDFRNPIKSFKLSQSNFLIKIDETWNEDAAKIHGISKKTLDMHGRPISDVLTTFISDAEECDIIVSHNLAFDKPILLAEAFRKGLSVSWWPTHEICTMLLTKNICKILSTSKYATSKDPYKWPKLTEVWQTLYPTSEVPTNLHNAAQDVTVLVQCFQELVRRGLLILPKIPIRRDHFSEFIQTLLEALEP